MMGTEVAHASGAATPKRAPPQPSEPALAARDFAVGLRRTELWGTLGWHDVRQRYRRSIIGPFWITISMGMMIGGLGFVYAALFRQNVSDYFPFLALGIIIWGLVSSLINDGCATFFNSEAAIKQMPVPLSVHVFRMIWRNLLIFAHNLVIYIVVILVFNVPVGAYALWSLAGLAILILNGVAGGFLLGILSARFRDIPLIVSNITQMVFFLTPIIWKPELLPQRTFLVELNPFYYIFETIRRPLLGQIVPTEMWVVSVTLTLLVCAVASAFFVKFRRRIAYWV
jgi:ABC-type polysaccharide/polyol phosphate export permease